MEQKTFIKVAGWIFGIIAIAHALRLTLSWVATINGFVIPLWWSVIPVIIGGDLAYQAKKLH